MDGLRIVIGFLMLVGGHQLFWIFSGGVAFLIASSLIERYELAQTQWDLLLYSLAAGGLGVILTRFFKKLVVALASFVAGAYLVYIVPATFGWLMNWYSALFSFISGVLCAVGILVWYDLSLILISTLSGSILIVQYLSFG